MNENELFVLQNAGHTFAGVDDPYYNFYLKEYEPEAETVVVEWTADVEEAIHFSDMIEAIHCWKRVRERDPVRTDGKPNRPLTAWSIMPVKLSIARERVEG